MKHRIAPGYEMRGRARDALAVVLLLTFVALIGFSTLVLVR